MKLRDLLENSEGLSPTDDLQFADDVDARKAPCAQAPGEDKGWNRTTRHGKNGKKAARIASMARTAAKEDNPEQSETIAQSGQGFSSLKINR